MIRSIAALSISTVLICGVGEMGARWWIQQYGNALDITRAILQVDESLGWKQRPNLDTTFLGKSLTTNEDGFRDAPLEQILLSEGQKVLVLGPSSTFGWGVSADETYANKLEEALQTETDVEVINAGQIGYSSQQGLIIGTNLIRRMSPDVVIIAYGVNDLDRNRFYFQSAFTDKEEFSRTHTKKEVFVLNAIFSNALTSLMYKLSQSLALHDGSLPSNIVRVPPPDFEANIRSLIYESDQVGARVILLTTAVNLPQDFVGSDEPKRITEGVSQYNELLRKIAADAKVSLLDIDALFAPMPERRALFVDPIHFSAAGNAVVAEGLFTIIKSQHLLSL